MASEIKVDTISEKTSAGGVTIDGLLIKDGGISGDVSLIGTTPTFTIGDAGAEDASLVFDGNAQDYYVGLDDSSDSLVLGLGSALGTTPAITINSSQVATFAQAPVFPDGSIAVADLDIDGATDVGAAIVDADLFIMDDGAGGTNRKVTASRIKTYAGTSLANDSNNRVVTADGSGGLNGEANCTFDGSDFGVTGNIIGSSHVQGGTATDAAIFRFTGDTDCGMGRAGEADSIAFYWGGETRIRLLDNKGLSIQEASPETTGIGALTINQGANDAKIISLKSSDVAHGITSVAQTDTYGVVQKFVGSEGGINILGLSDGGMGMTLSSLIAGTASSTKATGQTGMLQLVCKLADGTGTQSAASDANMVVIMNDSLVRFIFDAEGSFHADVESTTYDTYDDAQLVRAFDLSHGKGTIDSKFDKFISYNHEKLAELKLVGREEDGTPNHFVNVTGMQKLHNGAIWQQYEKHERLLEAVYDLAKEAVGEDKANAILDKHEVKRLQ